MNRGIPRYSVGSLESKSMEYTVFRNLKRHQLSKDSEEEFIHEKRRRYDNEAIENDFVRSCLVTTTRHSRWQMFKIGVLKNFLEKQLCWSLFVIKFQALDLQLY